MPQLRQNIITRDWVIIATERAKRPDHFTRTETPKPRTSPHRKDCPFCPGNETETEKETFSIRNTSGWQVRVIPNKFPALSAIGERIRTAKGIYRSMTGVGIHEVIIEHPLHNITTALMSKSEVCAILNAYKARYSEIRKDDRLEAIIIFKNHGESAGTSIEHPHSQLAATPIVPTQFRTRNEEAMRYFDDNGECVFCRTLTDELRAGERIFFENRNFVAFVPYAALSPFHIWILPRRHASSFDEITDEELPDFAEIMQVVLAKLYHGLNNPDYNYSIRSIPLGEKSSDYFHWYLTIVPRVSKAAGFEIGSGMYINTLLPEESAKFLKNIQIPEA